MHSSHDLRDASHDAPTLPQPGAAELRSLQATGSVQSKLEVTVERRPRLGRRPTYHSPELSQLLFSCWLERERMCAKRLVLQLSSWLQEHERTHGTVSEPVRSRFLALSHATIDRVLKPLRDDWYQHADQARAGARPRTSQQAPAAKPDAEGALAEVLAHGSEPKRTT